MSSLLLELNFRQKNITRLFISIFGLITLLFIRNNIKLFLLIGLAIILVLRDPTAVYIFWKVSKRDILGVVRFIRLHIFIALLERKSWTIARIFHETVSRTPDKICFITDNHRMTFQDVDDYSNKIASYFKANGFKRGDCVCLLMETKPEYPCIWLGLSKIGVITALVNSQLRRETLLHSINIVKPKAIIVGTELSDSLQEIIQDCELQSLLLYQHLDNNQRTNDNFTLMKGAIDLTMELQSQAVKSLIADIKACKSRDKLLYVYTSGTTGLPKAAIITNSRYLFMASGVHYILAFQPDDIIYNPLPLYHTAGGIVGVGNSLVHGCTSVLRKKFSASNFWTDCIQYECTIAQYIGEICRYLLTTPPKSVDTAHKLRLMYGNGLRPQIWSHFASRFNIPHIGEIYGSTEGNSNLANITNHVGAIGFLPLLIRRFLPIQIIRVDDKSGEPIRDKNGFCICCKPGETGLLIGKVDSRRAATSFHGYADESATAKKLIFNTFGKNDVYFNSGDMIVSDILGFVYFKDRTGDTFRWHGENVATLEVEAIITNVVGLKDCVVYGVDVPYAEGKAGMAAIVDPERKIDFQHLSIGIRGSLPPYARPLFIRILNKIPLTATFKLKKRYLMQEAFDLNRIQDPIYYLNKDGIYRPLNNEQYYDIMNGRAGL